MASTKITDLQYSFEDIVRDHIRTHRVEQCAKIALSFFGGYIFTSNINNAFLSLLAVLILGAYCARVLFKKPDLRKPVTPDEVKQLSPHARRSFAQLLKDESRRDIYVSDLESIVRTASEKSEALSSARQKEAASRNMREQQARALYEAERDTEDKRSE